MEIKLWQSRLKYCRWLRQELKALELKVERLKSIEVDNFGERIAALEADQRALLKHLGLKITEERRVEKSLESK